MMQNPECASHISPNDLIGVIFGKEHPSRVRGLSTGACPTIAFQHSTTRLSGINFASSSTTSPNTNEKFVKIENELAFVKNQVQMSLAYIASKEDVLEQCVAMVVGLIHSSTNEVYCRNKILLKLITFLSNSITYILFFIHCRHQMLGVLCHLHMM